MSDKFNPYSEWLGLSASETAPDHYSLLGLDKSVTDAAAISSAADQAMSRVRACKPGPNAAAWAQLLDRIDLAKMILSDPSQRASYDQQSTASTPAISAPINPNLLPPGAGPVITPTAVVPQQPAPGPIDPMAPVAPLAASPLPVAPQANVQAPVAAVPQAVPYLQPAATAPAAPNPMAPVAQAVPNTPAAPMAPVAPSPIVLPAQPIAVPTANSVAAQVAPVSPHAVPQVAGPMLAAQPVEVAGAPKLKRKQSASARTHNKSGGLLGPILIGGSIGALILVVVGVGFYLGGSNSDPGPMPIAAAPNPSATDGSGQAASTIPRRLDEMPESERPKPEPLAPAAPDSPLPPLVSMTPFADSSMEPTPPETPMATTPDPMAPAVEPIEEPAPTREGLRALSRSLTNARAAIGELKFAVVDREIAEAFNTAKLDEHKAKIGRLQLLSDYVSRFHAAISETLGRLQGGEELRFENDLVINIVESSPERLIFRMSGRRAEYNIADMPAGLARRLGEMSLDTAAPETSAMKAAFISVNPKVDDGGLEKARGWWDEAAGVSDVQDLITAINDDYSLREDIMGVPLEPGAMTELAARADRLKDATTIEDFAKEYQAVIDESLKTIEADLELTVGASTTVTISEVKSDRIMLTVADEPRGFQLSKLPLGLAASIAERILPRDEPLSMVMKGAYFAARDKNQPTKQFRPSVLAWWRQAGEMDPLLQPVIRGLAQQYPE